MTIHDASWWRLLLAWAPCLAGGLLVPAPAMAQSCDFQTVPHMAFGAIGPTGASTSGTASFLCRNDSQAQPRTFTVCLFVNPQNPVGVAPRQMVNWSSNPQSFLRYDLYADAARTQILGSQASGHVVHATTVQVDVAGPHNGYNPTATGTLPIYASLPPGQAVAAGQYVSQNTPVLRFAWRLGAGDPPSAAECASGNQSQQYFEVRAQGLGGCWVDADSALAFGQWAALDSPREQTLAIRLQCPAGTQWRVGLDNGLHAAGNVRRMAGPAGFIEYELYRDSARSQRWGSNVGVDTQDGSGTGNLQSVTVYGRVPAQPVPGAGQYADRVQVTIQY